MVLAAIICCMTQSNSFVTWYLIFQGWLDLNGFSGSSLKWQHKGLKNHRHIGKMIGKLLEDNYTFKGIYYKTFSAVINSV